MFDSTGILNVQSIKENTLKRAIAIGTFAAFIITSNAHASSTIGDGDAQYTHFEDNSISLAIVGNQRINRDGRHIYLVTFNDDGSSTYDRIDISGSINLND